MPYIICTECNGYYKLKEGESLADFEECECGGVLTQVDSLNKSYKTESSNFNILPYIVCTECEGYYKLKEGESLADFEECECGGSLTQVDSLNKSYRTVSFNFKILIILLQIAVIGILGLSSIGIEIPIIRQPVCFFYLLFVPGVVTLKLMDLNEITGIEKLLISVGLSIIILILLGLVLNTFYSVLGIYNPLSLFNIILVITLYVVTLYLFASLRNKDFSIKFSFLKQNFPLNGFFFLCLLPFFSIIGTYFMNFYNTNIILMILIIMITLIPILIVSNYIPKSLYPLSIFVISISLLYQTSLISMQLWGWDIQSEYYYANLVTKTFFWNTNLNSTLDNVASINILAPIFSIVCNLDVKWVFKIVYPFIFSLVPLGLYSVFKNQLKEEKIAFLSCFFFMSFFAFFVEMVQLARQQIAELFLVLLIILIINKSLKNIKGVFLFLLFSIGLIISHYGVSYLFMLIIIFSIILFYILEKLPKISTSHIRKNQFITPNYVLFFMVVGITWYMSFSQYNAFEHVVLLVNNMFLNIKELVDPNFSQGMATILLKTSFTRLVIKYVNLAGQLFILIGVMVIAFKILKKYVVIDKEFFMLSLMALIMAIFGIVVPYFGGFLNVSRLYHITLFFLAPFCIIGFIAIFELLSHLVPLKNYRDIGIKFFTLFLVVSMLFNSGLITQFTNEVPYSIALSHSDNPIFSQQEVEGAKWLTELKGNQVIYADEYRNVLLNETTQNNVESLTRLSDGQKLISTYYIFYGNLNILTGKIAVEEQKGATHIIVHKKLNLSRSKLNKIYNSGGTAIYFG